MSWVGVRQGFFPAFQLNQGDASRCSPKWQQRSCNVLLNQRSARVTRRTMHPPEGLLGGQAFHHGPRGFQRVGVFSASTSVLHRGKQGVPFNAHVQNGRWKFGPPRRVGGGGGQFGWRLASCDARSQDQTCNGSHEGTKLPRHLLPPGLKGEEFVSQPGRFHELHGFGGAMHVLFCLDDEGLELGS